MCKVRDGKELQVAPFLAILVLLMSGCSSVSAPTQASQTDEAAVPADTVPADVVYESVEYESVETAIPALIHAEREASIVGDLARLSKLWREDAQIIDGRNTADPTDDYTWRGKAAVLDRYVLAVFPNPPPPLNQALQPEILMDGEEVIAVNGVDRWRFSWTDGRWQIAELIFLRP